MIPILGRLMRETCLLLDTCALLWLGGAPEKLSESARRRIETTPLLCASPISLWEITLKHTLGKLGLSLPPREWFDKLREAYGIMLLPMDEDVMVHAAHLPFIHKDPADRFIIATALLHSIAIVTGDTRFAEYGVETIA